VIVDTSALVAIVVREPGFERLLELMTDPGSSAAIGTSTVAELALVLSARLGSDSQLLVTGLLDHLGISTVEFTEAHWRAAASAFWLYGRSRHPAGLNFGDCLTYAVASLADEPLLFVGEDFTHTDLIPAL